MRRIAVFAAVLLMLAACTSRERPDEPSLKVIGQEELPATPWAALSLDGRNVLYHSQNGLCLRRANGTKERCLDQDPTTIFDPESVAWSPDGRKLAITEPYRIGQEPDIHVADIESGQLTDLTDDGIASQGVMGAGGDFPSGALVDAHPSWSADGKEIRFLRRESTGVAVMTVPARGGTPTRLGTLDTEWYRLREVAWSANSVAWISGAPAEGGTKVRVATLAGGEQHTVLAGEYRMLSFSADGEYLLADQQDQDGEAMVGTARIVPAKGGHPVPVASGGVRYPTWAAKGHALAYVEGYTVKVVSEPGARPRILYEHTKLGAADHRRLGWARGVMLIRTGANFPVVLRLLG